MLFATYQSAVHPAGPQAQTLADLWWFFCITCTAVWVIVMLALLIAIARGKRRTEPDYTPEGISRSAKLVGFGLSTTVVILITLLVVSVAAGRSLSPFYHDTTREIRITGHQWWWQIQYTNRRADMVAETSNELHLPAGENVRLILDSADVIHSLWIPNLHGKRDLIPGKQAILTIQADVPGIYRAQCAEFCGFQHAKMGLIVVVEPKDAFERWLANERTPARNPSTAGQQRGQQVFLMTSCAICHTIKGTQAGARTGPDLTHIGSRRTIGSGILPNNRGHMSGWVSDAQAIKPGVLMPPNTFEPDDLHALVDYLESLK
ncbi:MAG: cytochrome c oxidase subunit II [Thermoanaerobaculia bacterium]